MWDLSKLLLQLQTLHGVLEHLSAFEKRSVGGESGLDVFGSSTREALGHCKAYLEQLAETLEPPTWAGKEMSKRRALIVAAGWLLKEKDTK